MKEELVSIIVPVYKVEKDINQCIQSIQKQTYKNIEIILVDDGSPDKCGDICDEYAEKDNRIVVIHKKNGGLSDARNAGIREAKGKYIAFVDSDDYIEDRYVELLHDAIIENNVMIAQCGINQVDEEGKFINKIGNNNNEIKTSNEMLEEMCQEKWNNVVAWNKLYLKKLFEKIEFPKGKIHEDEFTTYKIIYSVDKIAILEQALYNYRKNSSSITGKKFNEKRLDALDALKERLEFFRREKKTNIYNLTLIQIVGNIRVYYVKTRLYMKNSNDLQQDLLRQYRNFYKQAKKLKEFDIKDRIRAITFYIIPNIWTWAKNRGEKGSI